MNDQLQAQTDQLIKALSLLQTSTHQDALMVLALGVALLVVCLIGVLRRR
jgi:hypothetical protein